MVWSYTGVASDAGPPTNGILSGIGVQNPGNGICQNSGSIMSSFSQICFGFVNGVPAITTGGSNNPSSLNLNIRGINYPLPASFASSTVVNVVSSGALCNNVANDTLVIQNDINVASNAGTVYVPPGVTCMVGTLSIPSNTHLTVDGTLKLVPGTNGNMLAIQSGASYIVIDGHGTLNGNASAQTGGFSGGITNTGPISYLWVRDITSTNWRNTPSGPVQVTHAWFDDAVFSNSGNSVGFANASSDCHANGLTISNINDEGFAFYGGVFNCSITNSTITGSAAAGISVLNDAGQSAASHDLKITNNIVYGNSLGGVDIATGAGATAPNYNIAVTANRIYSNGQANLGGEGGVHVGNAHDIQISVNQISRDGNGTGGANGVLLDSTVSNAQIVGNTIWDEGQGSTLGVGINLNGNTNVTVSANTIFDDQGTKTMAFTLDGTAGANTQVLMNLLGATIGGYNLTPASDTIVVGGINGSPSAFSINTILNVNNPINSLGSANFMAIGGSATTVDPTLTASGSDSVVNLGLVCKGACSIVSAAPISVGNNGTGINILQGGVSLNAVSALSLGANAGFVALPNMAGIPTGAPSLSTNCAIDTTNGYLNCYYAGAWHKIAFSNGAG